MADLGPADPEAFERVQSAAEAELGPDAPELVGADEAPAAAGPSADDSEGPGAATDEGPPEGGDVELVVRTAVQALGLLVGAAWPEVGGRIRRAAGVGAARFAQHFGPRLGHRGAWAAAAVVCTFLDPPRASDSIVEVPR